MVLSDAPQACLWIVGADPDDRIWAAAHPFGERVRITGKVPEITDFLRRAVLSICPIRLKVGMQTKILEALSFGTPVVTTPEGNWGTQGVSGEHLWVESDPQAFARRIADLLRGDDWDRLSAKGRSFVAEHFSWDASTLQLEHLLRSVSR
jgi:glycosyltransferase involved in cell wall biosynthesis